MVTELVFSVVDCSFLFLMGANRNGQVSVPSSLVFFTTTQEVSSDSSFNFIACVTTHAIQKLCSFFHKLNEIIKQD